MLLAARIDRTQPHDRRIRRGATVRLRLAVPRRRAAGNLRAGPGSNSARGPDARSARPREVLPRHRRAEGRQLQDHSGRDSRLPGPERRGQVDDRRHPGGPDRADARRRLLRRRGHLAEPRRVPAAHRLRARGAAPLPVSLRPRVPRAGRPAPRDARAPPARRRSTACWSCSAWAARATRRSAPTRRGCGRRSSSRPR